MNQIRISTLNAKFAKYVTHEEMYSLVYKSLSTYIYFNYDNYKDLKKGLIATIRNKNKPEEFTDNIIRKIEEVEKESMVFESQSDDGY